MRIAFIIPSKDGGEGFSRLLETINHNIEFAKTFGIVFEYQIIFIINGKPDKPLVYLSKLEKNNENITISTVDFLGKVRSINYGLSQTSSDIVVMLDDDIFFDNNVVIRALEVLKENKQLQIIGFKNVVTPYDTNNIIRRVCYDIINVRSLKDLYNEIDPFLFGRLLIARRSALNIPDEIINEDQYLSIIHNGNYQILQEKIFYEGEYSMIKHIRRVLRIEAGRKQIKNIFGNTYEDIMKNTKRDIDKQKFNSMNLYYKMCYYCYRLLRFFTNSIIPRFKIHETNYW